MQHRTLHSAGSKSHFVVSVLGCMFSTYAILAACTAVAADVETSTRSSGRTESVETTVSKPLDDAAKNRGIRAASPRALRSEAAIREALEATADLDFTKTPLNEIVGAIGDFVKVDIVLDKRALADVGISSDTPMTVSLRGISVRAALELILRNLSLTWIVRNEVILITTPEEAESCLETRVYNVPDLVLPLSSHPFDGMYVPEARGGRLEAGVDMGGLGGMGGMARARGMPTGGGMGMFAVVDQLEPTEGGESPGAGIPSNTTHNEPPKPAFTGGMGGSMSGMGVGMGGMGGRGGGFGASHVRRPAVSMGEQRDFDSLIELITTNVNPITWDEVGGPGSIGAFDGLSGMLIFNQTQEIHQEVEKLIDDIRTAQSKVPLVTVRAFWLSLDMKQLDELLESKSEKNGGIDRKMLREIADNTQGYIGAITCFSGQTVHIASGHGRSAVVGAIPVVGSGIGYQPIVSNPQCGAMLQITPQVLSDDKTVVVDLWSSVVRLKGLDEQVHFLSGKPAGEKSDKEGKEQAAEPSVTLDRLNLAVEQLGTTLRLPLGETTLVGGLTREPSYDQPNAAAAPQLYLFIEVTAK